MEQQRALAVLPEDIVLGALADPVFGAVCEEVHDRLAIACLGHRLWLTCTVHLHGSVAGGSCLGWNVA